MAAASFRLALVLFTASQVNSLSKPFFVRPPDPVGSFDRPHSDLTIDQLIRRVMEGHKPEDYMALSMDSDGKILTEFDMLLTENQLSKLYAKPSGASNERNKRKAYKPVVTWRNSEVPYVINPWDFSGNERAIIQLAMDEWERHTCIKFRNSNSSDEDKLVFRNGIGCNSQLGQVGGAQGLNLEAPGCRFKGLYLHEIGHALGLVHEHQLPNRDDHISIIWDNVKPDWKQWFNKYDSNQFALDPSIPYDLSSVMHYGIYAFSKDDVSQTIRARDSTMEKRIGRVYKKELSFYDIKLVNTLYKCAEHCPSKVQCSGNGYVNKDCQCVCPDGTNRCQIYPPVRPQPEISCENKHTSDKDCDKWAAADECSLNPIWMIQNCQKSCKKCDKLPDCKIVKLCDNRQGDSECDLFARAGECTANPAWMLYNCKASCGECSAQEGCRDLYPDKKQCEEWKRYGQCDRNQGWMRANCRATCGVCSENDCRNSAGDEKCFADSSVGECTDNATYMRENCQAACGKCGSCFNELSSDGDCIDLANAGECSLSPEWMGKYCKQACDACENPLPIGEAQPCRDKDTRCNGWAQSGECEANPGWMIANCQKSCDRCTCTNKHNNVQCDTWAASGECESNLEWMADNCQKSCRFCTNLPPPADRCSNSYTDEAKCTKWASEGECFKNPLFMLPKCRKSCTKCDTYVACDRWSQWSAWTGCTRTCGDGMTGRTRTCLTGQGSETEMRDCNEGQCPVTVQPTTRRMTTRAIITQTTPGMRTTASPTVGPDCRNIHSSESDCELWARHDHCETNPMWMSTNCARSCGICKGVCSNKYRDDQQCDLWAEGGQCEANPGWMLPNCAKACNQCSGPEVTTPTPSECENKNSDDRSCDSWAEAGHCKSNPGYMLINCARSCGCEGEGQTTRKRITTTPEPIFITPPPPTCIDKNDKCPTWANSARNFCTTSMYVRENCEKSCRSCDTSISREYRPSGKCRDELTECSQLARQGKCLTERHFMKRQCKLSCELCQTELCTNTDTRCDRWAATNACHIFPKLMGEKCRLACGYCTNALNVFQPRRRHLN